MNSFSQDGLFKGRAFQSVLECTEREKGIALSYFSNYSVRPSFLGQAFLLSVRSSIEDAENLFFPLKLFRTEGNSYDYVNFNVSMVV